MSDSFERDVVPESMIGVKELVAPIARGWRVVLAALVLGAAAGYGGSYLVTPQFTATASFIPPQQQSSGAAAALASLGALANLAGGSAGATRNSADQYVALMQSVTVGDRMIDKFGLMQAYDVKFRQDARRELGQRTQLLVGKKDGMISVSVEDPAPAKAAAMANQFIEELRRMTSVLAVSEAQQRRLFFERQLQDTKTRLASAQVALQDSGVNAGTLRAEPRSAAENYARLRAQLTAAEIRLQTLRSGFADSSPEVRQVTATIDALRLQLAAEEQNDAPPADAKGADYVGKYREFKYQETLFDLMARQYELARIDEAREGALIQVVDPALVPERKSKPRRSMFAAGGAFAAAVLLCAWLVARSLRRAAAP